MKRLFTLVVFILGIVAHAQTTPNLGLALPPQGVPNWGVILNNNFSTIDSRLGGIYRGTWSASVTYNIPQMVNYNGATYISLINGNLNNIPSSSPSQWAPIGGSGSFNTLSGDAISTSTGGATTVVGLKGNILPALSTGFLNWTGSAWALSAAGTGTLTTFSCVTANGVSCSVANPTTTPAATFTLGAITPTSTNGVSAATMAFMDATSSVQTQLNGKQGTGNYITALTGDGTAAGPGSVPLTLATVTSPATACGDSSHSCQLNIDAKGRITSSTPVVISGGSSGFPITIGSTAIAASSTTTSIAGLTVDGVSPTTFGFVDPTSSIQTQLNNRLIQVTCQGATDLTTTIQADLNAATTGQVVLLQGLCTASQLTLNTGNTLTGGTLQQLAATTGPLLALAAINSNHVTVSNMTLLGNCGSTSTIVSTNDGIHFDSSTSGADHYNKILNVHVGMPGTKGFCNDGIHFLHSVSGGGENLIADSRAEYNAANGIEIGTDDTRVINTYTDENGEDGIIDTGWDVSIIGGKSYLNGNQATATKTNGIHLAGGAQGTLIDGVITQGNPGYGAYYDAGSTTNAYIAAIYSSDTTGIINTTLPIGLQALGALATGILKSTTATGIMSIAGSADVIADWTGSCSSSTFLRGDGACAAPSGAGNVSAAGTLTNNAVVIGQGTTAVATISADTTTTHALFATAGAPAFRALASGDIPNNAANTSGTASNLSGTPALPNGTTATTQTVGDNTTKLATDAFVLANAGSGGISGLTANFIPKAGSSTTLTANSALDDGVTNTGKITSSEPIVVNDSTDPNFIGFTANGVAAAVQTGMAGWGLASTLTTAGLYLMPDAPGSGIWTAANASGIVTNTFTPKNGTGVGIPTGPSSTTSLDVVEYTGTVGQQADSGVLVANLTLTTATPAANQICVYGSTAKTCTPTTALPTAAMPALTGDVTNSAGSLATTIAANAVTGAKMANNTVTATQLAAQYSKGSCTEVWGGSGTSFAMTSGDDAISNNSCYNDSGVTRTITAVKCRSDNAANTTVLTPTFGSAGTGTAILTGTVTCGNSYAYSSTGTVTNASWTTGTGIDPGMSTVGNATSIAMIVEYTY